VHDRHARKIKETAHEWRKPAGGWCSRASRFIRPFSFFLMLVLKILSLIPFLFLAFFHWLDNVRNIILAFICIRNSIVLLLQQLKKTYFTCIDIYEKHYTCKISKIHWEKNLVVSIRILVDSTSMSVGKWTNQNSCRNYQMNLINFFLLNLPNFLVNNTKLASTKSSKIFSI